jgi:MFS transporter, DHA2 family, methylenomycin A resistance protein
VLSQNRIVILALSLGFLTTSLDASALSVALTPIHSSFDVPVSSLQWVSNAFVLMFAGFILSAGRLADRFGPKAMFKCGALLLALSSIVCTLAVNAASLVAARLVQGVAGAILTTSSFALLAHTFPTGSERSRAFATLNFSASIGLSGGPLVAGILIAVFSWRLLFLVNVLVAVMLLVSVRLMESSRGINNVRFDIAGQVLSVVMLTGLAATLIEGTANGFYGRATAFSAVTVAAFIGFIAVERKVNEPMLPLSLFRKHAFSVGSICIGLWRGSLYGLIFFLALYFESGHGYSSFMAGLAFLPLTAGPLFTNTLSAPLSDRFGAHAVATIGMSIAALGGLVLFAVQHPPYVVIAVGMFLMGAGAGAGIPAVGNVTLAAVAKTHAGVASGVFNAGGQTGSLVGVAIIGGLANHGHAATNLDHAGAIVLIALALSAVLSGFGLKVRSAVSTPAVELLE